LAQAYYGSISVSCRRTLFLNVGARARFAEAHTLVEIARSRVVADVVRPLGEDQFAAALGACGRARAGPTRYAQTELLPDPKRTFLSHATDGGD